MKKLAIVALIILSVSLVNAKEKEGKTSDTKSEATMMLSGSIADQNSGESLVGVEVKIEGTNLKTYTDFDGNFAFKNVKPGEYKVVANYISYKTTTETLQAGKNEKEVKIKLQTSN